MSEGWSRSVIDKLSDPPEEAVAGDSFEVKGKVKNVGRRSARGLVTAELDSDSGADDVPLGDTVTDRIRPGKKDRFEIDAEIPSDLGIPWATSSSPQIGNGGYDAGHYLIELDYDPVADEFLAGTKTTISTTATQDLSEFSLDFQDVPVSAVTVNGEAADSFEQVDAEPPFDPVATQPMKLVVERHPVDKRGDARPRDLASVDGERRDPRELEVHLVPGGLGPVGGVELGLPRRGLERVSREPVGQRVRRRRRRQVGDDSDRAQQHPADLFLFFPTYVRGAMTYEGYRQIVGQSTFFDFARELQSRFAYGNVSSQDVVDLALEISGFEGDDLALLEEYFDQWLNQAGRPTLTAGDFTERHGRPCAGDARPVCQAQASWTRSASEEW